MTQTKSNFGLLDTHGDIDNSTNRWIQFEERVAELNKNADLTESYKGLNHWAPELMSSVVPCTPWRRVP